MGRRVARTRNLGKWTEAQYWSQVRSALRQVFSRWRPAQQAFKDAFEGEYLVNPETGRENQAYRCAVCGELHFRKQMHIDHIIPAGSLKSLEDLAGFLERLTPEDPAAFQIVCKGCHGSKTKRDNKQTRGA